MNFPCPCLDDGLVEVACRIAGGCGLQQAAKEPASKERPDDCDCETTARGSAFLCDPCTGRLELLLDTLPGLELDVLIAFAMQARTTERVGGARSAQTPLPFNDGPPAAIDALAQALGFWVHQFMPTYPSTGKPSPLCAAIWLRDNLAIIRKRPSSPAFAKDLTSKVARVHRTIDLVPDLWYAGQCLEPINGDHTDPCQADLYGDPT